MQEREEVAQAMESVSTITPACGAQAHEGHGESPDPVEGRLTNKDAIMSNPHRKARRVKRYRPKPIHAPMLVASALVLGPLEAIVDRLEIDGTVDVDGKGNPVIQDMQTGEWYDAAGGIEGLIWHLDMHCTRHGVTLPLDGLRELHIAFKYCAPVQASTMHKLREALPILRRAMAMADKSDQLDLMRQTMIKAELEAA